MELTQRLECTQDLCSTQSPKEFPDQIGFLGICGEKYPIRKGPNKIGRDPDTCNIVLNMNSISRQHAVINILNNNEFMLMDLDSANKTKLSDKTLQAYIPHPLKNGDMVQFGHVFGVFRLIEDDCDLPMTQALDIPETPVQTRHVSKIAPVTTVPESPDVSDKDDSFITPSQPKPKGAFKSPSTKFIKSSGRTISLKPLGLKKIDNVFWNSSKKSESFSLQSESSLNDSSMNENDKSNQNLHELETQVINHNESLESIHNANTQCIENVPVPSIYTMDTQIPSDLPKVCKIQDQKDLHLHFTTDKEDKENDNNIFNAETQVEFHTKQSNADKKKEDLDNDNTEDKHDTSNDLIMFDEIEQHLEDINFESQPLLGVEFDVPFDNNKEETKEVKNYTNECPKDDIPLTQEIGHKKRVTRLKSDSSTDCEDIEIELTQKVPEKVPIDDDLTDCEDEIISKPTEDNKNIDDDVTDCEDNIEDLNQPNKLKKIDVKPIEVTGIIDNREKLVNFDEMLTQVIAEDKDQSKIVETVTPFEDISTQILEEEPVCFEEALTQQIQPQAIASPFKIPQMLPNLNKKKPATYLKAVNQIITNDDNINVEEENYYAATQQILNDLCTEREPSPEIILSKKISVNMDSSVKNVTSESLSQESDDSDIEEKINSFVANLSKSQISDVVGVEKPTSGSLNSRPKTPILSSSYKTVVTDSKSDQKIQETQKQDLTNVSKLEKLPTKKLTRVRKPTLKMQNCDETAKDLCEKILNPKKSKPEKLDSDETQNLSKKDTKKLNVNKSDEKSVPKKSAREKNKEKGQEKSKGENKKKHNETQQSKKRIEKRETVKRASENTTKDILHYLNVIPKNNSPRRTRSRSKQNVESTDKKSPKIEKKTEEKSVKKKNKRNQNKRTEMLEPAAEKEVRRSERKRSSQKLEEETSNKNESKISTASLESSTVYNLSSDSNQDSFNKFKRPASGDGVEPKAKKSKPEENSKSILRSTPSRRIKTHYLLFTAFPCNDVKVKLEKLGAVVVDDVTKCTVVLTLQIRRTFKLLCAVGLGKPIVGPMWAQACVDTNIIVDPWLYLIKDEATEKRFQFNLSRSLAAKRGFLKGYNVSSTPKVLPNAQEMKLIVECSGGTWKEGGCNWICVSSDGDKALWPSLIQRGATIVSTEFILAGVLRQRVEIETHRLT